MKTSSAPVFFARIGCFGASPPLPAAPKKTDERNSALVAALRVVGPDPLGGRLGLAATAARMTAPAPTAKSSAANQHVPGMRLPNAAYDQRASIIWRSSVKA